MKRDLSKHDVIPSPLSLQGRVFQNVTHQSVLKAILILWTATAVLVCLPFMGFGLFFDKKDGKGRCKRYRLATEPADVAYAYLYFTFGKYRFYDVIGLILALVF